MDRAISFIAIRFHHAYRRLYRWATHRLYKELAWAYEIIAWLVSLGHWDPWRSQVLDHLVGDRVLELGFGTGVLLAASSRRGLVVWGADPAWDMHRVAARRLRRRKVSAPRVQSAGQALPFPAESFDTVLSTFPTEYIADPNTLYEVARVLRGRRGEERVGRFVITGIGFRTDDRWLARLLSLVFGGFGQDSVALYARFAEAQGFVVTVIDDRTQRVRVPVLVLERVERS